MKRNNDIVATIMGIAVLATIMVIFALLAGCAEERNPLPEMTLGHGDAPTGTGEYNALRAATQLGYKAGYSTATVLMLGLIVLVPWVTILLVPGFLAGKWEMQFESVLLLIFSALMWNSAGEHGLRWLLIGCVTIPAIIMLPWRHESGKIALFGLPACIAVALFTWWVFDWLRKGLVNSPLMALCIIVAVIVFFVSGGKKNDAPAKAEDHGGGHH